MTTFPQKELEHWFLAKKRSFPWRENPTPYAVWISEIMLQQTRASVVVDYFTRWMRKFPTLSSVAIAPLEELVKAWEGLGYYSRVKNIKKGALLLSQKEEPFPSCIHELQTIPGIGPYTAGAIASFAFHKKAAAVDANVARVISRYYGLSGTPTRKTLEEKTLLFLPERTPWVHMEALIELGATLCQKKPTCAICPLQSTCLAHKTDQTSSIPPVKKRPSPIYQHRQVAIILWDDEVLIEKKEEGRVLGGLMEFPSFPCEGTEDVQEKIFSMLSIQTQWIEDLPMQKQSFTRYQIELSPSVFFALNKPSSLLWEKKEALSTHSFSSGHKRVLRSFLEKDTVILP